MLCVSEVSHLLTLVKISDYNTGKSSVYLLVVSAAVTSERMTGFSSVGLRNWDIGKGACAGVSSQCWRTPLNSCPDSSPGNGSKFWHG